MRGRRANHFRNEKFETDMKNKKTKWAMTWAFLVSDLLWGTEDGRGGGGGEGGGSGRGQNEHEKRPNTDTRRPDHDPTQKVCLCPFHTRFPFTGTRYTRPYVLNQNLRICSDAGGRAGWGRRVVVVFVFVFRILIFRNNAD